MMLRMGALISIMLLIGVAGCGSNMISKAHVLTPRITKINVDSTIIVKKEKVKKSNRSRWAKVKTVPPKLAQDVPESSQRAMTLRYAVNDLGSPNPNLAYQKILQEGATAIPFILECWKLHETQPKDKTKMNNLWGKMNYQSALSASTIHAAALHDMTSVLQYFLTDMIVYHSNYKSDREVLPTSRREWEQWFNKNKRTLLIYMPGQERVRLPFKTAQ